MTTETSTVINELSNGNPNGTRLGQNASDLISFFGSTPVAQQTVAATTTTTATTTALQTDIDAIRTALTTLGLFTSS